MKKRSSVITPPPEMEGGQEEESFSLTESQKKEGLLKLIRKGAPSVAPGEENDRPTKQKQRVEDAKAEIAKQQNSLTELLNEGVRSGIYLFEQKLKRWSETTAQVLAEFTSRGEKENFEYLYFKYFKEPDDNDPHLKLAKEKIDAYFIALIEEIDQYPKLVHQPEDHPGSLSQKEKLLPPEKVTFSWLFQHVPVKDWWKFGTVVVATVVFSFLLGFGIGSTELGRSVWPYILKLFNT